FDLRPDFTHHTFFIDEEGFAVDPHELSAIHVALFPDAVELGNPGVGIGQQWKGQTVFLGKLPVRCQIIGADAKYDHAALLHFMVGITERARFRRTAGRVVFWIKIQNYIVIGEGTEFDRPIPHYLLVSYGRKHKVRRRLHLFNRCIAHNSYLTQLFFLSVPHGYASELPDGTEMPGISLYLSNSSRNVIF